MGHRDRSCRVVVIGVALSLTAGCLEPEGSRFGLGGADASGGGQTGPAAMPDAGSVVDPRTQTALLAGQQTFRYETFGDEAFWGDLLRLHEPIAGQAHGGTGPGVSPKVALSLGLKIDAEVLPRGLAADLQLGAVDLDDPLVTLTLLQLNAVVGVTAFFDDDNSIKSLGIHCALCHSTVDDSFAPGIGRRLDGRPNRDLNMGAIIGLSPDLSALTRLLEIDDAPLRKVLASWGPGKFDMELLLDGKGMRPDGRSAATLIPPAFGLAGVSLQSWTGWGPGSYWSSLVANLAMMGKGTFFDPRLDDAAKFPVAARARMGHVQNDPDLITPKLADLQLYQLSLASPPPPADSFDPDLAKRGGEIFQGKANCARCHRLPLYTEPGSNTHTPKEIGVDDFQARRSPDGRYRTAPLRGLHTHLAGGFYHDGRFATLLDVVNHYDQLFTLGLSDAEKSYLIEYLRSL
jgi:hypothetical protein